MREVKSDTAIQIQGISFLAKVAPTSKEKIES